MKRMVATLGLSLCLATSSMAQTTYQYTTIDIMEGGKRVSLLDIANGGMMAGNTGGVGALSYRVSPALTATPVTCPSAVFTRYPFAVRQGPQLRAMNNTNTIGGDDEGVDGLWGITQGGDGTCSFFRYPGSIGTTVTTVNDNGMVAGFFWNSPGGIESGLKRFHGFRKDGATFVRFDGPAENDRVYPLACNVVGDCVGYLYQDIQPDNSYIYQAFYWSNGVFTLLDSPSGENLWLTGLNNAGQAVGVIGSENVSGGQAILYDHPTHTFTFLPEPTPDTLYITPMGINDNGAIVGVYTEKINDVLTVHQFLATPSPAAVAVTQDLQIPAAPQSGRKPKREKMVSLRQAKQERTQKAQKCLRPVIDDDGTVLLTNGQIAYGKRYLKAMKDGARD